MAAKKLDPIGTNNNKLGDLPPLVKPPVKKEVVQEEEGFSEPAKEEAPIESVKQ